MSKSTDKSEAQEANLKGYESWFKKHHTTVIEKYRDIVTNSPNLLRTNLPAKFSISQLDPAQSDPEKMVVKCVYEVLGSIYVFYRKDYDVLEVGFDPDQESHISKENLDVEGTDDIYVWTMLSMDLNGTWVDLNIHEAIEPILFTEEHHAIIEKIDREHLVHSDSGAVDLRQFTEGYIDVDAIMKVQGGI